MKKIIIGLMAVVLITGYTCGQSADNIINYKYVIIDYKAYPNGQKDVNQVGLRIYNELTEYGFTVLNENQSTYPDDFIGNPCLAVICSYNEVWDKNKGITVSITFKNCKDEIVYTNTANSFISSNTAEYYQSTAASALKPIKKVKYAFNTLGAIKSDFWKVDTEFKSILKKLKFVV